MKKWLHFKNHKDIGTLLFILSTLIGFAGMTMTTFILFNLSYSSSSLNGDQLYNVLTILYMLLMTFFLSTVAFFWGFKNWLLPLTLKITNMANFHRHLMNFSPVLKLVKHLQMLQLFVKYSSLVMYHKMFYINQFTASLLTCLLMLIIQCVLMKYGMESFGAAEHCYTPDTSASLPEISSQVSDLNNTPPALSNSVVIQIPSTSVSESIYRISTNSAEFVSQMVNTNEVSLEIPSNEPITNLEELNTLVPVIDESTSNSTEEPIYEIIPDLSEFSSQAIASDQACCMTVTQQMECSSYMGFFVGLSLVAAFALYLVYFNGAGEMTRSCNFPDLMKQLEDIFRNL